MGGLEVCSMVVCLEGRSRIGDPGSEGGGSGELVLGQGEGEAGGKSALKEKPAFIEHLQVSGAGCEGESDVCA